MDMGSKQSAPVIECFGLPGSGKSTLSRTLSHAFDDAMPILDDRAPALWRRTVPSGQRLAARASALADIGLWILIAKAAAQLGALAHPDALRRLAQLPFKRKRLLRLASRHALILDQGMAQDLWSAMVSARSTDPDISLLATLLRTLYRDIDLHMIALDLDPPTAARRIAARQNGLSRFDGKSAPEITHRLASASGLASAITAALHRTGLPLSTFDARQPPETLAEEVMEQLKERSPAPAYPSRPA